MKTERPPTHRPVVQVSVHPLMQHVPIAVLKGRMRAGLMDACNFATVVTDFTTCHNTWCGARVWG